MSKIFKLSFCLGLAVLPLTVFAQTQERILSYDSSIEVFEDSSLRVKETISVISAGDQIKHGIYRDFPIAYKDHIGHRYLVSFDLLEVTRDGFSEPYHIERAGNGLRIYIGKEDVFIPTGEHTYTITYKTERQLGFFEDHDELYWNVTGNGWIFPIESASATVKLPVNVPKDKITTALYTGVQGSTEQDGSWTIADDGKVGFKTTRPLGNYEGFTIVVGWPKGVVTPPTSVQTFRATLWANLDYIVGTLGFILVLIFYVYFWHKKGRDPKKGTVIPHYEAPQGRSAASLRFIRRMGSDNRGFASAIIHMAVKGWVTIAEDKGFLKKTTYTLTKKDAGEKSALAEEEQLLEKKLFEKGNSLELNKTNALEISEIQKDFADSLKKQAGKKYFAKNTGALILGVLLTIVVIVATVIAAANVRFGVESILQILFWPALFLVLAIVNIVFGRLLRAFTYEGRKLVDEIEGFKLFLTVTEKDRLTFHNPPEKTPELFEKMLPYALALGVEHQWAQQFAEMFAQLDQRGVNYTPIWYYGSLTHFSPDKFASTVGSSFTGVVGSVSSPPGSSSGFSGGGSGGGGGGGGGGGW